MFPMRIKERNTIDGQTYTVFRETVIIISSRRVSDLSTRLHEGGQSAHAQGKTVRGERPASTSVDTKEPERCSRS